jgi:hypothetical protein
MNSDFSYLGDSEAVQAVPSWTDFNKKVCDVISRFCAVSYCPVIDQFRTQFDTVYTLLQRSLAMAHELGQMEAIIVLDQAIYAKAAQIW